VAPQTGLGTEKARQRYAADVLGGVFLLVAVWTGWVVAAGLADRGGHGWAIAAPLLAGAAVAVLVREGLESTDRQLRRRPRLGR